MKCAWCKGTGKECGCGLGYCAHCKNGETSDPPFGPPQNDPSLNIITPKEFDVIIDYQIRDIPEQIEFISIFLTGEQLLTADEIQALKNYWDDDYRDETLGETLNRAAWLVAQRKPEILQRKKV